MSQPVVSLRLAAAVVVLCSAAIAFYAKFAGLASAGVWTTELPEAVSPASLPQTLQPVAAGTCETAGPIEVEASAGTTAPTAYATLKAAFDAVNAGTHTGTITIDVCGDTTETATATINASGSGTASYTGVTISPAGGAARTISGAMSNGSPLIDLNGADNVRFDGLNANGNSLTLSNTTVSAASGTSTVKFEADATGNTITNSTILGSASMPVGTNGGTIYFAAGAASTGNDNNTISNNDIGPAGSNLPTKAIYSSGTATNPANYNSGIFVTGNNIHDYFAVAVQSAGIYVSGGSTDWTISDNRFYQSAARTETTGAIHSAIQIASSNANNCTITGNTIGSAAKDGTGVYSFAGAGSASRFYPIYISAHGTATASSIQGNMIKAIALSGPLSGTGTSSPFAGILVASGLVNIGSETGNTIGSSTAADSITYTSSSSSAAEVYGIYYSTPNAANISNNSVGGIGVTNSSGGAVDFYGIRANTAAAVTNTISTNTVGFAAAPITNTATAAASNVFGIYCQTGICSVSGNKVQNLSMSAGNAGAGSAASMIGLWIDNSGTAGNSVSRNTVSDLSNTNISANTWVSGIHYNGGTTGTNVVERNFVYNLKVGNAASTTGTVNGINVQGGTTVYKNNFVALGNGVTAGNQFNGINETAGTDNFYHNSVYIGGTAVVGASNTFTLQSTVTANTRAYRDNIFYNARSNGTGTGKHYAIRVGGTGANPAGLTINNNVYLANGAGRVFGLYNGADVADLAAWQTAVGQDAASYEADPKFVDSSNAIPDLHIDASKPTVVDANGFDVGVTDDFDGEARSQFTPVDIGADAGNFTATSDVTKPVLAYGPLFNTSSTGSRTLAVRITDDTGVATDSLSPRVYFRVNAGNYSSAKCTLTNGNLQDGTYDCVISPNSAVVGDSVYYFVVAQDDAGNIASNPAGAVAVNVNTINTPPGLPNRYNIVAPTSGTLSIGSAESVKSLTNPGGLFEQLNNGVVTGNITVNLTSDLAAETGAVQLNQFVEEGTGDYSIVIQSAGAARLIEGSSSGSLITLNGADRVTFSGLAFGPFGMSIRNKDNAGSTITFVNDATNNSIISVTVEGGTTSATKGVVTFGGGINIGNDSNSISDSVIRDRTDAPGVPTNLVYSKGSSAAAANSENTITNSTLKNFTGTAILLSGSGNSNFNSGWTVTSNTILEEAAQTTALTGIAVNSLGTNTVSGNIIHDLKTSGDVTAILLGDARGTTVSKNSIYSMPSTDGSTGTLTGIVFTGAAGKPASATLDNNTVSIVPGFTNAQTIYGIRDAGLSGNTIKAYYNSVLVGGTASGSSSWAYVRGTSAPTATTLINNIFFNNRTGGTEDHFAVGDQSADLGSWSSDHNVFAGTGATAANFFDYGTSSSGTAVDFAAWTAGPPARDANSQAGNPSGVFAVGNVFASLTDLHVNTISTNPASNAGTPVAGFGTDFDGDTRDAATPDIGVDEFAPEFPGKLQFGAATYSVNEDVATVSLSVSRTGGTDRAVSAQVTFAGGSATGGASCGTGVDYVNAVKTVNFAAGSSAPQTVTVPLCDDTVYEGDETFNAALGSLTGGVTAGDPASAVITIKENEPVPIPNIQLSPTSIDFGTQVVGTASGGQTVTITNSGTGDLIMGRPTFGSANPADFSLVNSPENKTIVPGETYQFQVVFTPLGSGTRSANLTLPSNDPDSPNSQINLTGTGIRPGTFQWSAAAYSVSESGANVTLTINRTNGAEGPITLTYSFGGTSATGGGSCTAGVDYINSTTPISFANGEVAKDVKVPICGDLADEANETFTTTLESATGSGVIGAQKTATVTIMDDDTAGVVLTQTNGSTSVAEGGVADNYTLVLTSQPTANVVVTISPDSQLINIPAAITFTPSNWDRPQPATTAAVDDNVYEGAHTGHLSFTAASTDEFYNQISVTPLTVNITDNDVPPAIEFEQSSSAIGEGGGQTTISLVRSGAQGNAVSVHYSTSDVTAVGGASCQAGVDYITGGGTVTWLANDTASKTITVGICEDAVVEPIERFNIALSDPSGGAVLGAQSSHAVSIADNETPMIEFSSVVYNATEGVAGAAVITRTGDPKIPVSVTYSSSDGTAHGGSCGNAGVDYDAAGGLLILGPGEMNKVFSVSLCTDLVSEDPAETINLRLSDPSGATLGNRTTAMMNVLDAASEFRNQTPLIVEPGRPAATSTINVSGYPTPITGVRVTLYDVGTTTTDNLDVLLVGPNGTKFILVGDTGGNNSLDSRTLTFEDEAGVFLPDSELITDGRNYKPTSCMTPVTSFAGTPPAPYLEPGCGAGTQAPTLTSAFGGSNPNGNWTLYVRDDDGIPLVQFSNALGGGWGLQFIRSNSQQLPVSVSGRVATSTGTALSNVQVTISGGALVQPISVVTGTFGMYRFDGIPSGLPYTVSVTSRRYSFATPSRIVSVQGDVAGVDFTANPRPRW